MNTSHIYKIIYTITDVARIPIGPGALKQEYAENEQYSPGELRRFINSLLDKGQKAGITFLANHIDEEELNHLLSGLTVFPLLVFQHRPDNPQVIDPILIYQDRDTITGINVDTEQRLSEQDIEAIVPHLVRQEGEADQRKNGKIVFISSFPLSYLSDDSYDDDDGKAKPPTPIKRLFRLLNAEKKDIVYIYIYAVVVGLISLVLPLGIQAIIGMISGGLVFSSVIVLISVIIVAVLASGGLQIMQITLVEVLQQRIFAKAAFEFAFRVPKIRVEAWQKYYPPELMNRFFDVLNIQKSLPKILVELSGAILQILFGLILLSFYHPLFLAFAILLVTIVMVILYLTGPKGLQTSLSESKYKYKTVNWLEQLARNFNSFRLAGDTNLHMEKMEDNVKNYLYYRSSHFSILRSQMVYIVLFKTFIISGLLILGTVLVVDRQITLGQFVASEVIVVLVVAAVEKIIFSMETIYDLLTALEKVGNVTDLPLEKNRGVKVKMNQYPNGLHLSVRKLNYNYPNSGKYALNDVSFEVQPGERICIAGTYAAGKHTLGKIMAGVMGGYEGSIAVNGVSLRDIHANTFRTVVDNNLFYRDLFEGTILENIALSRTRIQYEDIWWAINKVGLSDFVNSQPEGLYTMLGLEGKQPSESIRHKIILARCVASKPKLLVFNDDLSILQRWEREQIISFLTHPDNPWTLLVISKNPAFMQACDKILLMDNNTIVAQGTYNELESHAALRETVLQ